MYGWRRKRGSQDIDGRTSRRAFLTLGTFVLALAWAAPQVGAQPFGESQSERERSGTRQKTTLEESLEGHRAVARSCERPRSFRHIAIKGGIKFAREGEVFAFDKREIRLGRCEEVEITLENTDNVRHPYIRSLPLGNFSSVTSIASSSSSRR